MALALQACGPAAVSNSPKPRTVYVAAVELKGGVTADKEAYPDRALPTGGGYILKAPDDKTRWEVSTYRWDPGTIVVNQGDTVTLEIVGINGDEHPFTIEGYWVSDVVAPRQDHAPDLRRGQARHLQDHLPQACAVHAGRPGRAGETVMLPGGQSALPPVRPGRYGSMNAAAT